MAAIRAVIAFAMLGAALPASAADIDSAVAAARAAAAGPLRLRHTRPGGPVAFLAADGGGIAVAVPRAVATGPDASARAFLQAHGGLFGLAGADDAGVERSTVDALGMAHVRLRQERAGVPVAASGMSLHLRHGRVVSALARTVSDADAVDLQPTIAGDIATAQALALILDLAGADSGGGAPSLTPPRLELFNRGLLDPGSDAPTRLAWFVEATAGPRREWIWVDARDGAVLLHFNQNPEALFRRVYDANDTPAIPGTLVRSEGDPPTGDPEADNAYAYSGDTYSYYLTQHGRDSFDDAGAIMDATVGSTLCGNPCLNAYWIGTQTVFGLFFANADDLVGHEWTHGVTQYEAGLIYFMESGAMNESFSDIFGETVDLLNGAGGDLPANRWWLGEDIAPPIAGIRNMLHPEFFTDPGRMSDPAFVCNDGSVDAGGVHSNSGVGNKAYALMVDGGTYNGYTVTGIGLIKAGKIEYRALTQYLLPSSTYADKYDAINQSCLDLVGVVGITAADCTEVQKALDAVEMSSPWPCVSGTPTPSPTFSDTPTATPTVTPTPACDSAPRAGCAAAAKGKLLLKHDAANSAKDKLLWKWANGPAPIGVFGNPIVEVDYSLCVYENGTGPTLRFEIPSGTGWSTPGGGKLGYAGDLSADGIQKIKLKPGAANGKILIKGRGPNLGLTTAALAQPLTLQLVRSGSLDCWESVFTAPAVKATSTQFKDKIP
jgi:Zn-dependent metalloprotease